MKIEKVNEDSRVLGDTKVDQKTILTLDAKAQYLIMLIPRIDMGDVYGIHEDRAGGRRCQDCLAKLRVIRKRLEFGV